MKYLAGFLIFFSLLVKAELKVYTPSCVVKAKEVLKNEAIKPETCMVIVSCILIDREEFKKFGATISQTCKLISGKEMKTCTIDIKKGADLDIGVYVNTPLVCQSKTCSLNGEKLIETCSNEKSPIDGGIFSDWYLKSSFPKKYPMPENKQVKESMSVR